MSDMPATGYSIRDYDYSICYDYSIRDYDYRWEQIDVERLARAMRKYLGEEASLRAGHIAAEYIRLVQQPTPQPSMNEERP